jgi:hypothetical protein
MSGASAGVAGGGSSSPGTGLARVSGPCTSSRPITLPKSGPGRRGSVRQGRWRAEYGTAAVAFTDRMPGASCRQTPPPSSRLRHSPGGKGAMAAEASKRAQQLEAEPGKTIVLIACLKPWQLTREQRHVWATPALNLPGVAIVGRGQFCGVQPECGPRPRSGRPASPPAYAKLKEHVEKHSDQ